MDSRELTILLIKLSGAALIVYSVINVSQHIPYFFSTDYSPTEIAAIVGAQAIIPIIFGLWLFFVPVKLSSKIIGSTDPNRPRDLSILQLEQTAISVLGMYLLFITISDITAHMVYIIKANQLINSGEIVGTSMVLGPERYASLVATVIEFIVALWFIFGSKGIVNMIIKFRGRGSVEQNA